MAEYKGPKIERGSHREEGVGPNKVFKAPSPEDIIKQRDEELTDQYRRRVRQDGTLTNALTISNAALKARQLFKLGAGLGGFARSLMIRGY